MKPLHLLVAAICLGTVFSSSVRAQSDPTYPTPPEVPQEKIKVAVQITELGRSTAEDATVTLNEQVFADIGMDAGESQALVSSIETLRRNAGDF